MFPSSNIVHNQTTKLVLESISIQMLISYWAQFNSKPLNIDIQTEPGGIASAQSRTTFCVCQMLAAFSA